MLQPNWNDEQIKEYLTQLECFSGNIEVEPLIGGLCNKSFVVSDENCRHVARIGTDIEVHGIIQSSVQASMKAAADIGISPKISYFEPSLVILDYLTGGCLRPEDFIEDAKCMEKIVAALKMVHSGSAQVRGTLTYFWPFQVIRNYVQIGTDKQSRLSDQFPSILRINDLLEKAVSRYTPVLTHNDTVPQNFMFDDDRNVWIIDWDYGGYGHPMFDLVGVSSNADMAPDYEKILFEMYFGSLSDDLHRQLTAFKLILNLREYMWGMVQEVTSELDSENVAASMAELYPGEDPGYEGYTNLNRNRFEANWTTYRELFE